MSDICEIGTNSHFSKENNRLENIIAGGAASRTPFAFEIGSAVFGSHLLRMTIDAAVRRVYLRAAQCHSRRRRRINIAAVFVGLRVEAADLQVRHDGEAEPGKGENS